jgi:hypothetical protein
MLSDQEDIQELEDCSNPRCNKKVVKNGRLSRCIDCRTEDTARKRRYRAQKNKENIPSDAYSALHHPPAPLLGSRTPLGPAGINVELADIPDPQAQHIGSVKRQKVSQMSHLVIDRACWLR